LFSDVFKLFTANFSGYDITTPPINHFALFGKSETAREQAFFHLLNAPERDYNFFVESRLIAMRRICAIQL